MIGMRPTQNRPASHRYLLVSALLALLALALSPVTALGDSSGTQYEDALPTADGGKKNDPPAKSSTTNGGASAPSANSGSSDSGSSGSSSEGSSSESGGAAATTAGGDGGTGQGSQDKSQDGGGNQGAQDKGQATSRQPASQVTSATETSDDDGGSSPLVPILIAIAILAAISVGAVVMRQRRQRGGTSVSPKPSN
jgi:cobalamin biosynthesis Mg chelatase CobN